MHLFVRDYHTNLFSVALCLQLITVAATSVNQEESFLREGYENHKKIMYLFNYITTLCVTCKNCKKFTAHNISKHTLYCDLCYISDIYYNIPLSTKENRIVQFDFSL